ncbi:MAG: FAD-binding protein [Sandaracinaceae bacterium]|nr:MAG: FAD-binding protein [Sandaracinaceae bacterium]
MPIPPEIAHLTRQGTFTGFHGSPSTDVPFWIAPQNATQLRKALELCITHKTPASVKGSSWSISSITKPNRVLIDLGQFHNEVPPVRGVDSDHVDEAPAKGKYVHVRGNVLVRYLNHTLAMSTPRLALSTSGAANGQAIAGAIATGSHGAAIGYGAIHEAVRAVCLLTSPDTAVLVQPEAASFNEGLAKSLASELGVPVVALADDEAFGAALVGLGAVGVVYSLVLEVEPLYQLKAVWVDRDADDQGVFDAIDDDEPARLAPSVANAFNVAFAFNPYPEQGTAIWGSVLRKIKPTEAYVGPRVAHPRFGNSINFWIAQQSPLLRKLCPGVVDWAIRQHYHDSAPPPDKALFPGDAFGDTTLAQGMGRGIEFAVHRRHAGKALRCLLQALKRELKDEGRALAGAMGMRYVGPSRLGLLGMNCADRAKHPSFNGIACFEVGAMAGPRDANTTRIFQACERAMRELDVPFTLHWGLENDGLLASDIERYFGGNVDRWRKGRNRILPDAVQQACFRNPLTAQVGLTS